MTRSLPLARGILRRPVPGPLAVLVALLATLVFAAACTSDPAPTADSQPAAGALLHNAGSAMRTVSSVHFTLDVHGTLAGVPVQSAVGDLNAKGQAKGNAKLTELGQLFQVDFVLFGNTFYIKGPTGGYSRISADLAGNMFDPAAILDPNRGIAQILTSVRGAHTEGRETVNGTDTYKIGGRVDKNLVSALVPGVDSDVDTTLWVTADGRNLPVKAEFAVPGTDGSQGATVDVTISHVNSPVTVTAPA